MRGKFRRDRTRLNVEKTKVVSVILYVGKDTDAMNDLTDIEWVKVAQKSLGVWMDPTESTGMQEDACDNNARGGPPV